MRWCYRAGLPLPPHLVAEVGVLPVAAAAVHRVEGVAVAELTLAAADLKKEEPLMLCFFLYFADLATPAQRRSHVDTPVPVRSLKLSNVGTG